MNIKEAKEQIKYAMTAYFSKDDLGNYEIPASRQRPVFLIGAPGIGKTAIMEQIAAEMGVLLVSYSMTHHTRQSALGLPYIAHREYGGTDYQVSEYTMSEIISSVYDAMAETGLTEGILFLDEINCVSETLTPSMLQFLQFKMFGRHALPEGWLVVTAGNPPEYNRTVREFDIVTLDRLKKIEVEPDFDAWKEYAWQSGIHPAIMSYLEIKKNNFYQVETLARGKSFVTARGWEDLSRMIILCEKKGIPVDRQLTSQYLQDAKISADFAAYYDLFRKYRSDYQIESILSGTENPEIRSRAVAARFDEKVALLSLLTDTLSHACDEISCRENVLVLVLEALKQVKNGLPEKTEASSVLSRIRSGAPASSAETNPVPCLLQEQIEKLETKLSVKQKSGALSLTEKRTIQLAVRFLAECINLLKQEQILRLSPQKSPAKPGQAEESMAYFTMCRDRYRAETLDLSEKAEAVGQKFANAFSFLENVYGQGQEILLFVTELTISESMARFISHYGCEAYDRHSRDLMFYERSREIASRAEALLSGTMPLNN